MTLLSPTLFPRIITIYSTTLLSKKIIYEGQLESFLTQLKDYYYKNKYFYIVRPEITHTQFNTILRQICKKNNIHIENKIKYENSKYSPEYHIFLK